MMYGFGLYAYRIRDLVFALTRKAYKEYDEFNPSIVTRMKMDNIRMVRVGNRIVNLMQITFAEYTPAYTPPPLDAKNPDPKHHPISYTRPESKPSVLTVHFFGGEQHQFFGELADQLNDHFDLLV